MEPTIESLQAQVEQLQAMLLDRGTPLMPGPGDPRLPTQEELNRRYVEVRERNIKQNWLDDARFAKPKKGGTELDLLRQENAAQKARLEVLEKLVLDNYTEPKKNK